MLYNALSSNALRVLLCAVFLMFLAACGDDQPEQPAVEPAAEAPAPTLEAEPEPELEPEVPALAAGTDPDAEPAAAAEPAVQPAEARSRTHVVTARSTAYDPVVLKIEPGDTVSWTNMGGHFNLFEAGLIPKGAEPWSSSMGQNVSRTFDVEGVYIYQCPPHFSMGMVGAIIVGEAHNLDEIDANATGMYRRALARVKQALEN
jgi:pseudoazurin